MAAPAFHLKWFNPVRMVWGQGLLQRFEPPQAFFVLADPAAISLALQAELQTRWGTSCLGWHWQTSTHSSIRAGQALCQELWPLLAQQPQAALLAIGGGTTLDLAKLLRFRLTDLASAPDVWRQNQLPATHQRHSLWLAPTTSGTGSELTPWATVWDLDVDTPTKRSWSWPNGFADLALIDPSLTLSCPESLTRDAALDTLAHALESLWNHQANTLTRPLAIEAAREVLDTLPLLLNQLHDVALRQRMAQASVLAGMAMSQTQTALAHALSYALTLHENMPHGQACAVHLPMVMDMAAQHSLQTRHDLEQVFGAPIDLALPRFKTWLQALGITPRELRDSPAGQLQLSQALGSARGRNFLGSAT